MNKQEFKQEEADKYAETLIQAEKAMLEEKRKVTGKQEWSPRIGVHGNSSGVLPEMVWKRYSPMSLNEKDYIVTENKQWPA